MDSFTRVAVIADLHIPHVDHTAVDMALAEIAAFSPDCLVMLGDVCDFYSVSFWVRDPKHAPIDEELEECKSFLRRLRREVGDCRVVYIEGNHEERLRKYLWSRAPELSGIKALSLPSLLSLDSLGIKYVRNKDLLVDGRAPFKIGSMYFLHGHEVRASWGAVNIARNIFLKTQQNVVVGHFHQPQQHLQRRLDNSIRGCWSVGCLCNLGAEFLPVNNWRHGMAVITEIDSVEPRVQLIALDRGK